jgi:hypothetical protein
MENTKPNPVVHLLPSLTDVAFLMPLLLMFVRLEGLRTLLGDGDTGWHVRTGEWIIANGTVPYKDLFSYTMPNSPWYAWEWLWDLIYGWLHLHWGMAAVVLASILVLCTTSALLFRLILRNCPNRLVAIALTFVAVTLTSIHWLARPHLFTMLFVVIWLSILDRVERGRTTLLWFLPPLTVLWTNLHGGFFVGIIILGVYTCGQLLDYVFSNDAAVRSRTLGAAKQYTVTAGLCGLASFLNPYTYHLHVHIARYLTESYHFDNIVEFQSMNFHGPLGIYQELLLGLALLAVGWFITRGNFTPALLIVIWAHMALIAVRNLPLFALIAMPAIAQAAAEVGIALRKADIPAWLAAFLNSTAEIAEELDPVDRQWRLHLLSTVLLGCVILLAYGRSTHAKFATDYNPERYPAKAFEVLQALGTTQRIFTDDEWGDYLAYRSYPNGRVFVDGRSDFYGGDFGKKYLDVINVHYGWQATLDHYGVGSILLPVSSSLAGALKESRHWRVLYDDGLAIVFVPAPETSQQFSTTGGKERSGPESPRRASTVSSSTLERTKL